MAGIVTLAAGLLGPPSLLAQQGLTAANVQTGGQCNFSDVPGVVWWGTSSQMTLGQLAAYLAPVYWFSPDEPLLSGAEGAGIMIPQALPFETPSDGPVVYYQFEELVSVPDVADDDVTAFTRAPNPDNSIVDFEAVVTAKLSFFAYFESEVGVGAHQHDLEATEFKVAILQSDQDYLSETSAAQCDERNYVILVTRVSAKAHGIKWFWNVIDVDPDTRFPMFLFVEEGKHGLATDKNSDGYFTPGYDVSRYKNDAWGVRDIIRGGTLFTGGYQAWMTKVRQPEHRVFPPLPDDSPLIPGLARRQYYYDEGNAVYDLRPFPSATLSEDDPGLHHFMHDKDVPNWPELSERSDVEGFVDWVDAGGAVKSLSIAFMASGSPSPGNDFDGGFAFAFPLFIVKNMEAPMLGGFLVWRMYLKDENLQDFGWMMLYTPSASRWFDTYFAAGAEWDDEIIDDQKISKTWFVLETGLKFRVNISTSPMKFLGFLTEFWGVRAGIRNYGALDIKNLVYVAEIGAGVF
jgi:hypothetical protein